MKLINSLLRVSIDPGHKVRGLSVDSGVSSLGTSVAPGDNTGQLVSAHEWSTRVTLAGVLASSVKTSTDHGVGNVVSTVGISAVIITHNGDRDLLEDTGQGSALGGGSPSGNGAHGSFRVLLVGGGQADGCNMGSHGGGGLELKQTDVVVDVPAIVVLVHNNTGNLDILLVIIVRVEVVGANSNTQPGGRLTVTAVGSGDNPVGADQGATAHEGTVGSTTEQHDLVGELAVVSILATNNLATSTAQRGGAGVLQQLGCIGSTCGDSGESKKNEHLHDDSS